MVCVTEGTAFGNICVTHASSPLANLSLAGNKDNYEKAISCYRDALQHNPTLKEAAYGLGLVLANTKAYDAAIEAFNRVTA